MSGHVDAAAAWIYRGVWASVVALFRVPPQPPTLPAAGEPVRSIRPAAGYLRYLKFLFWVLLIPGDVLPILGWIAVSLAAPVLGAVLAVPFLALIVLPDIVAYVGIHLRYDTTWYVLTDRSLRIRRGILNIHETTISFENVQNVEVRQGPLQRWFGIADVLVTTAGGGMASHGKHGQTSNLGAHVGLLQGLDDAPAVRDQILACVERTRAGGLGDEAPVAIRPAGAGVAAGLTPQHLTVLRDIRDSVRRLASTPT
nr:membrane-flanked domain containing protein [uncultured bacterium]